MNITACYVILFVIVVRLLLRKAPRIFSYILWVAVLFRLVCPLSFESIFSLIPANSRPVPENLMYAGNPQVQSGIAAVDQAVDRSLSVPEAAGAAEDPIQLWIALGEAIWLIGMAVLLAYGIFAAIRFQRRLKHANHMEGNIYEFDGSSTPFVFGILKPRIYLPGGISETERRYIIKHEQTHIRRFDHVIKPIAYLVLCIHWFNPLVWAAFFLMSEDMELSCDESVIRQLGSDIKKDYSSSLLSLSAGKRIIGGCPLAFGESNIKGRINNILNYKKPAFWIVIAAVVIVAAVCVGLVSNPQSRKLTVEDYASQFVRDEISAYENAEWADFKIVNSKITKLEKLDRFDGMLEYPVEIWRIEYRLKPDDISKVMLAGGMSEIDGWITEDGSMGKPLLVFAYERSEPRYLGCIYPGDGVNGNADTVPGRETALRVFLESKKLLPHETYKGEHVVVKFSLSTGETCQLLLSQPVVKGNSGIWCAERWMDGNGTVYYDTPETAGTALDFYTELQEQCDNGHKPWLLDPLEVSLNYINNVLGQQASPAELKPQYNAGIKDFEETPVSSYIGFISELKNDKPGYLSFHLDQVEWLTLNDSEKLRQLNVDPDDLPNGFYIYNPNSYPMYFQGTDQTRIRIIDPKDGVSHKDVPMEEFKDYLQGLTDPAPPFRIVTKDGYVQSIEEQYIP